jgi:hypothetical protein
MCRIWCSQLGTCHSCHTHVIPAGKHEAIEGGGCARRRGHAIAQLNLLQGHLVCHVCCECEPWAVSRDLKKLGWIEECTVTGNRSTYEEREGGRTWIGRAAKSQELSEQDAKGPHIRLSRVRGA